MKRRTAWVLAAGVAAVALGAAAVGAVALVVRGGTPVGRLVAAAAGYLALDVDGRHARGAGRRASSGLFESRPPSIRGARRGRRPRGGGTRR